MQLVPIAFIRPLLNAPLLNYLRKYASRNFWDHTSSQSANRAPSAVLPPTPAAPATPFVSTPQLAWPVFKLRLFCNQMRSQTVGNLTSYTDSFKQRPHPTSFNPCAQSSYPSGGFFLNETYSTFFASSAPNSSESPSRCRHQKVGSRSLFLRRIGLSSKTKLSAVNDALSAYSYMAIAENHCCPPPSGSMLCTSGDGMGAIHL